MTATEARKLLPCPFCGGEAKCVDIEDDGDMRNFGGSCICCQRCGASSAVHFDRKENLLSRAIGHQLTKLPDRIYSGIRQAVILLLCLGVFCVALAGSARASVGVPVSKGNSMPAMSGQFGAGQWGRRFALSSIHNSTGIAEEHIGCGSFSRILQSDHRVINAAGDCSRREFGNYKDRTLLLNRLIQRPFHNAKLTPKNDGCYEGQDCRSASANSSEPRSAAFRWGLVIICGLGLSALIFGAASYKISQSRPEIAWVPLAVFAVGAAIGCVVLVYLAHRMSASPNRLAEDISVQPIVVAELEFRDVQGQVFGGNLVEGPDHTALNQAPETLNRLRMDSTDNVLARSMVNGLMGEFTVEVFVANPLVSAEQANFGRDAFADESFQCCGANVCDHAGHDITLATDSASDDCLARSTRCTATAALIPMTVLRLATYKRLIDFDHTHQLAKFLVGHASADAHAHGPSGPVASGPDHAMNLQGANPLFADEHQVNDPEPFFEGIFGVLKDRADENREAIAVPPAALMALPMPAIDNIDAVMAATGARDCFGPALGLQERLAGRVVRELEFQFLDGQLVDCFGFWHRPHSLPVHGKNLGHPWAFVNRCSIALSSWNDRTAFIEPVDDCWDIASAPKDIAILVYSNGWEKAHFNTAYGKWIGYGADTSDTRLLNSWSPPTHWRHLPPDPQPRLTPTPQPDRERR